LEDATPVKAHENWAGPGTWIKKGTIQHPKFDKGMAKPSCCMTVSLLDSGDEGQPHEDTSNGEGFVEDKGEWAHSSPPFGRSFGVRSVHDSDSEDMRQAKYNSLQDQKKQKAPGAAGTPQRPPVPDQYENTNKADPIESNTNRKESFPVRVHLVGKDDKIHNIIGTLRDMSLEDLQKAVHVGIGLQETMHWTDLDLDARWMSDADWHYICHQAVPQNRQSTNHQKNEPHSKAKEDPKDDVEEKHEQPVWEGNRHTPISAHNCGHVLDMLKLRKGKDFISVTVRGVDDCEEKGKSGPSLVQIES
jgi:hypothetical protein